MTADQRRLVLVEAAINVIGEYGIAGATTRAITERAGMPLASFHYVFESRDALFQACLDEVTQAEARVFGALTYEPGTIRELCERTAESLRDMIRQGWRVQLALYELCFYAQRRPELPERVKAYREATRMLVQRLFRDMLDTYRRQHDVAPLGPESIDNIVELMLAFSDGITVSYLRDRDDEALDRLTASSARLIAEAIEARVAQSQVDQSRA